MRQTGILMMDAVIRLMEQGVSEDMAKPAFRDDAASGAVHGVTEQTEMFDVFAPGLEICRNQRRREVEPEKIFPNAKKSDRRHDGGPHYDSQGQLYPNSSSHLPASNQRVPMDENAEKDHRRIKQAEGKFEESGEATGPTRRLGQDKGPEFRVFFRGQMHVMHLVHHPIETERDETKNSDEDSVEFVQPAALPQQTVGGLVKSDEQPVHEMRREQGKRHAEPEPTHPNGCPNRDLGQGEREHESLERDAAHTVLVAQLRNRFGGGREVDHVQLVTAAVRLSGV